MTKEDWTFLFTRLLGLYLLVTYLPSFLTSTITFMMSLSFDVNSRYPSHGPGFPYQWQGPVISAIVMSIGAIMTFKTKKVIAFIQRSDVDHPQRPKASPMNPESW